MIGWCLLTWTLLLLGEIQTAKKHRVFGGSPIRYETHKYLVIVLALDSKGLCSGSILNSKTILTAAHCFSRFSSKFSILHYINGEFGKIADVTQNGVIKHPKYNKKLNNRHFDLAIMKTEQQIDFDKCIGPIPLARARGVKVSDKAIIAGFGRSDPDGTPGGKEGKVIITNCPDKFQHLICTLDFVRAGSGDSGGALVFRGRLAGVTSASCVDADNLVISHPCLTVYANVTQNIDWISSHLYDFITSEDSTTSSETYTLPSPLQRPIIKKKKKRPKKLSKYPMMTSASLPPLYRNAPENIIDVYLSIFYEDDMSRTNFTYINK